MKVNITKIFSDTFNKLRNWFFSRSKFTRTIFVLIGILVILPNLFIWALYHTRYALPEENGFSLEGRKALVQKDNQLYLYEWQKPDSVLLGIKNKYIETLIKDFTSTNNFPRNTAILDNGDIVIGIVENNLYKIKTINSNTKEEKTIKEYIIFNLDQFYKDYKAGKVGFNAEELKKQTSLQYTDKFQVKDNTISFVDFAVSEVDIEKPTEAVAFKRTVNLSGGIEQITELVRVRENPEYHERAMQIGEGKMHWVVFNNYNLVSDVINRSSVINQMDKFTGYKTGLENDLGISTTFASTSRVQFTQESYYIIGSILNCSTWYFDIPCIYWSEGKITIASPRNYLEHNVLIDGKFVYLFDVEGTDTRMGIVALTENPEELIFLRRKDFYIYDYGTDSHALLMSKSNIKYILFFK